MEQETQPAALTKAIQKFLLCYLILASILHLTTGLADNGDFSRIMYWFTSGPLGFSSGWPDSADEFRLRFFTYWLPYWHLDFPGNARVFSSALFLWAPGILLNQWFLSDQVLYLPLISLFPRFLVVAFLAMFFRWSSNSRYAFLFTVLLGFPYVLMFTATDYVAYFNSFYQETGSVIYLLGSIAAFGLAMRHPGRNWPVFLAAGFGFLLVTSKASNFLWAPILGLLLIALGFLRKKVVLYSLVAGVMLISSLYVANTYLADGLMRDHTAFASLFYGSVPFSADPENLLVRLHIRDANDCINVDPYTAKGQECVAVFAGRLTHVNALKSIVRDPSIVARQLVFGASNMQVIRLDELGKYTVDDPIERKAAPFQFWSQMKARIFPKGWAYLATIAAMVVGFIFAIRVSSAHQSIVAWAGLVFALMSPVEMYVAVFGDGQRDILKHLFMANILFDFAVVSFFSLAVLGVGLWVTTFFSGRNLP